MSLVVKFYVPPKKLAQLEELQLFNTKSLSAMAEATYQAFQPMTDVYDFEPSPPRSQAAAPVRAAESPKRNRDEIIIIDEPLSKRNPQYTLLPKDFVEDEESRQQQELERARDIRLYYDQRLLVKLNQAGALSDAWYDRLRILPNGEIGDHNGEPLVLRRPTSSPSAQAAVSENVNSNMISPRQWSDICVAFDRLPPTWHTCWADAIDLMRSQYKSGGLSLKKFQAKMCKTKEKHLEAIEEYLKLIQPLEDDEMPPEWGDFPKQAADWQRRLLTLFGIPSHLPNMAPQRVFRYWDPNQERKDRGMKADLCKLQGGVRVARAFKLLREGNDKTAVVTNRVTAMYVINSFQGLLHYLEKSGHIVIDVEEVFGEFYVPLGDMRCKKDTEQRIRDLYANVKRHMD